MDRIATGASATLSVTFYDGDDPVDADGNVTVTATRDSDGTAVLDGVTADAGTADDGTYTVTLPAQDDVDLLTVVWSGTFSTEPQTVTRYAELAGGFHVPLAAIRDLPNIDDQTKFPDEDLVDARGWWEDLAEDYVGVAFVPRYKAETFDGGRDEWVLTEVPARQLLRVEVDGTVEAASGYDLYDHGTLVRDAGYITSGRRKLRVCYEHGLAQPPRDLVEAALTAIRSKLIFDRSRRNGQTVLSEINEFGGTTRFLLPGPKAPTGDPNVDEVLNRQAARWQTAAVG